MQLQSILAERHRDLKTFNDTIRPNQDYSSQSSKILLWCKHIHTYTSNIHLQWKQEIWKVIDLKILTMQRAEIESCDFFKCMYYLVSNHTYPSILHVSYPYRFCLSSACSFYIFFILRLNSARMNIKLSIEDVPFINYINDKMGGGGDNLPIFYDLIKTFLWLWYRDGRPVSSVTLNAWQKILLARLV